MATPSIVVGLRRSSLMVCVLVTFLLSLAEASGPAIVVHRGRRHLPGTPSRRYNASAGELPEGITVGRLGHVDLGTVELCTIRSVEVMIGVSSVFAARQVNVSAYASRRLSLRVMPHLGPPSTDPEMTNMRIFAHYHPQQLAQNGEHMIMVVEIGDADLMFDMVGVAIPNSFGVVSLTPPIEGYSVQLRAGETWRRALKLQNPTPHSLEVKGINPGSATLRVMFIDRDHQLGGVSAPHTGIPPNSPVAVPFGEVLCYAPERAEYEEVTGFLEFLLSNGATFALWYNLTILAQPCEAQVLDPIVIAHRGSPIALKSLLVANHRSTPFVIHDVFVRAVTPAGAMDPTNQGEGEGIIDPERSSPACLTVRTKTGATLPPGEGGIAATLTFNVTECMPDPGGAQYVSATFVLVDALGAELCHRMSVVIVRGGMMPFWVQPREPFLGITRSGNPISMQSNEAIGLFMEIVTTEGVTVEVYNVSSGSSIRAERGSPIVMEGLRPSLRWVCYLHGRANSKPIFEVVPLHVTLEIRHPNTQHATRVDVSYEVVLWTAGVIPLALPNPAWTPHINSKDTSNLMFPHAIHRSALSLWLTPDVHAATLSLGLVKTNEEADPLDGVVRSRILTLLNPFPTKLYILRANLSLRDTRSDGPPLLRLSRHSLDSLSQGNYHESGAGALAPGGRISVRIEMPHAALATTMPGVHEASLILRTQRVGHPAMTSVVTIVTTIARYCQLETPPEVILNRRDDRIVDASGRTGWARTISVTSACTVPTPLMHASVRRIDDEGADHFRDVMGDVPHPSFTVSAGWVPVKRSVLNVTLRFFPTARAALLQNDFGAGVLEGYPSWVGHVNEEGRPVIVDEELRSYGACRVAAQTVERGIVRLALGAPYDVTFPVSGESSLHPIVRRHVDFGICDIEGDAWCSQLRHVEGGNPLDKPLRLQAFLLSSARQRDGSPLPESLLASLESLVADDVERRRIPHEAWRNKQSSFWYNGDDIIVPPNGRFSLGPIRLRAMRHVSGTTEDVLIIRNNHTVLDAVLVTGVVRRRSIKVMIDGSEALLNRTFKIRLDAEANEWHPREDGHPSFMDVGRHLLYAGWESHIDQLAQLCEKRRVNPILLTQLRLRDVVVPHEFDWRGTIVGRSVRENPIRSRLAATFMRTVTLMNEGSTMIELLSVFIDPHCGLGHRAPQFSTTPCIPPRDAAIVSATASAVMWLPRRNLTVDVTVQPPCLGDVTGVLWVVYRAPDSAEPVTLTATIHIEGLPHTHGVCVATVPTTLVGSIAHCVARVALYAALVVASVTLYRGRSARPPRAAVDAATVRTSSAPRAATATPTPRPPTAPAVRTDRRASLKTRAEPTRPLTAARGGAAPKKATRKVVRGALAKLPSESTSSPQSSEASGPRSSLSERSSGTPAIITPPHTSPEGGDRLDGAAAPEPYSREERAAVGRDAESSPSLASSIPERPKELPTPIVSFGTRPADDTAIPARVAHDVLRPPYLATLDLLWQLVHSEYRHIAAAAAAEWDALLAYHRRRWQAIVEDHYAAERTGMSTNEAVSRERVLRSEITARSSMIQEEYARRETVLVAEAARRSIEGRRPRVSDVKERIQQDAAEERRRLREERFAHHGSPNPSSTALSDQLVPAYGGFSASAAVQLDVLLSALSPTRQEATTSPVAQMSSDEDELFAPLASEGSAAGAIGSRAANRENDPEGFDNPFRW